MSLWAVAGLNRRTILNSVRAALAAVLALLVARALRLPQFYWAPISTIVVLLSAIHPNTGAWQRFVGTAVGAVLGALVATFIHPTWIVYGAGIAVCGIVCAVLRVSDSYRIAAITLTIVLLIDRGIAPWRYGLHRFLEVSLGIAVALLIEKIWPRERAASG